MAEALAFQIKIDQITPSLAHLADEELEREIVQGMATVVESMAVRAFDEPGLRPSSWPARKKAAGHPLLIKSGNLRQGIHSAMKGKEAVVGSPTPYAAAHQLGSTKRNIPARPFFPVLEDQLTGNATEEINEVVELLVGRAAKP